MTSCGELQRERRRGVSLGPMGCAHLARRQQERERRLRALIAIDAIGMKPKVVESTPDES